MPAKRHFIISIIAFCILAGCDRWISVAHVVREKNVSEWPALYATAVNHLKRQDCREAWDTLWPAVKRGDKNATYLLSEMLFEGMQIDINSNYKKDSFIFYIYSADRESNYSIYNKKPTKSEIINKFLEADLQELAPINQCLLRDDGDTCKNLAIDAQIIPSYESYKKNIDRYLVKNKHISGCNIRLE